MYWTTQFHRPTRGGLAALAAVIGAMTLAPLYLALTSLGSVPATELAALVQGPFRSAAGRSLLQIGLVVSLSLPAGVLLGLGLSLSHRRLRSAAGLVLLLPLMLPPFLWSIGWSNLRRFFAYRHQFWFDGLPGCLLTSTTVCVPLVAFATVLAIQGLSTTHINVLRLGGGLPLLLRALARHALPPTICIAVLAAIFAVGDPGAAQIMGFHGVPSSILIDFSARHDFLAAALKTCAFLLMLLPIVALFAYKLASCVDNEISGSDPARDPLWINGARSWLAGASSLLLSLLIVVPPILGIVWPLLRGNNHQPLVFAFRALAETASTTAFYSLTAGLSAAILGFIAALCAARSGHRRRGLLLLAGLCIAVPPSLHALGLVSLATCLPAQLDGFSRSGWIVGLGQGLRLTPLAAALFLCAWCQIPCSWHDAAACHGVGLPAYLHRIGLPRMVHVAGVSVVVVALLAAADVPTTMMLAPPGSITFPGRLFAVMDNASERLVASLCLIYLLTGLAAAACLSLLNRWRANPLA